MGVHPTPLTIYRSVGRRVTRDGVLWVRSGLSAQPRRLLEAARDQGARASGSRIFLFPFCFLLVGRVGVSIDAQE